MLSSHRGRKEERKEGREGEERVEVSCRRIWVPKAFRQEVKYGAVSHQGAKFQIVCTREFAPEIFRICLINFLGS